MHEKPMDGILFACEIPGRCPVKKNTQRVVGFGKSKRAIYSPQFIAWQKVALLKMKLAGNQLPKIDAPMRLVIAFHFANRQAEADLSNLIEGPQDALKLAGVIADDRLIVQIEASKHFGGLARTEIKLIGVLDACA